MFLLTVTVEHAKMLLYIETFFMENIKEITKTISCLKNDKEIYSFLLELLTESELADISKRWRIIKMLNDGFSQREIAANLNVSLCKVTRGAKIIKNKDSVCTKYLNKDIKNE